MAERQVCPNCKSDNIIHSNGDVVCANCGMVIGQVQVIGVQQQPKTTIWSYRGNAGNGTSLSPKEKQQLKLQRPYIERVAKDKTELNIMRMVEKLGGELALPLNVRGEAMISAKKLLKNQRSGKQTKLNVNDIVVLSIYKACRISAIMRRMKDISDACKRIGLDYPPNKIFNKAHKVELFIINRTSAEYLPVIIGKLYSNQEVHKRIEPFAPIGEYIREMQELAAGILKKVNMSGRNPWLIAAAAVCLADSAFRDDSGVIGRKMITEIADCGRSNLSEVVNTIREQADIETLLSPKQRELIESIKVGRRHQKRIG